MSTDPIIKQGETSTNVNMGADNPQDNTGHHSGSTAQPIPIQGQNSAQQTPQMAASHEQPYSLWRRVKSAATSTDDYFDHDNKVYQKKDGKTFLVTGAPEGDVELDADQTAKLDQARADKAGQDQKVKDAMANQGIVTEGFTNDPEKVAKLNQMHEESRRPKNWSHLSDSEKAQAQFHGALGGAVAAEAATGLMNKFLPGTGDVAKFAVRIGGQALGYALGEEIKDYRNEEARKRQEAGNPPR